MEPFNTLFRLTPTRIGLMLITLSIFLWFYPNSFNSTNLWIEIVLSIVIAFGLSSAMDSWIERRNAKRKI